MSRYAGYRGNGDYAVVVQTFTNSACTAGAKEARFLYSVNAGTAITPPVSPSRASTGSIGSSASATRATLR